MSTNFLTQSRHKSIYYFRRRIPLDLQQNFPNTIVKKSLNTSSKKQAIILARCLASQADRIFENIRSMKKKHSDEDLIEISYGFELHFDEYQQPILKVTDAQPEDTESIKAVVVAALSRINNKNNTHLSQTTVGASADSQKCFQDYINLYWEKAELKPNTIANYKSKLEDARLFFGDSSTPLQ